MPLDYQNTPEHQAVVAPIPHKKDPMFRNKEKNEVAKSSSDWVWGFASNAKCVVKRPSQPQKDQVSKFLEKYGICEED